MSVLKLDKANAERIGAFEMKVLHRQTSCYEMRTIWCLGILDKDTESSAGPYAYSQEFHWGSIWGQTTRSRRPRARVGEILQFLLWNGAFWCKIN